MDFRPLLQSIGPASATADGREQYRAESDSLSTQIANTARGDVAAFAALYDRTRSRTYGVALQILRDPASAREATEKTYRQVWDNAHCFDPANGSPQAWLTTLSHRHAVNRIRAEPGRTPRVLGCSNGNRIAGCHCVMDEVMKPMVCADGSSLNDWQRETIALAYYGGLTYREVADLLAIPLSTIISRLRTGMAGLRGWAGTA